MRFAEVAVDAPGAERQTFTYSVPDHVEVAIGHSVQVPFGAQPRHGLVVALAEETPVQSVREIQGVTEPEPLISALRIGLADWMRARYLSTPFEPLQLMLPPASGRRRRMLYRLSTTDDRTRRRRSMFESDLDERIVQVLATRGPSELATLGRELHETILALRKAIARLRRASVVEIEILWSQPRVSVRFEATYRLNVATGQVAEIADRLRMSGAPKQAAALEFLAGEHGSSRDVLASEAVIRSGVKKPSWKALASKGMVTIDRREVRRGPVAERSHEPMGGHETRHTLTADQEAALSRIGRALLDRSRRRVEEPSVFLLYGVTGSGKTEIYLGALERTIAVGKRGIVLVPEIALTPQTVSRFMDRFPGRVAVLHSGLSLRDQYDEWRNIRDGRFDVVIGPRRAVFAPLDNIGLVVVDEEQEWSYKQDERPPRYHARDVATELARRAGAVTILGSATPDIGSMRAAVDPNWPTYEVLRLPERVSGSAVALGSSLGRYGRPLAHVDVVDLREELLAGNHSIFSRSLTDATREALDAGGQAILFVNRRGAGSAAQCRSCGHALMCSQCSISLTYHNDGTVRCHRCGRRRRGGIPTICPSCRRPTIKPIGVGTERVVVEVEKAFPGAVVTRWDRDAVKQSRGHAEIVGRFIRREVDILVGTQMLAKGLDFPHVTLVGVVNADIGLHSPNFRAGERSFQLLCQVSGRAGRGEMPGRVVIQTYEPDHYAILAAAAQNYEQFYRQEIEFRRAFGYPPFARIARLVFRHQTGGVAADEAAKLAGLLRLEIRRRGMEHTRIIGPSPAPVERLRGRYRWQIEVLAPDPVDLLSPMTLPPGWIVDVDPVNVL